MPNPYTSILVVDDARFSTTVITRSLQQGGYKNIRRVNNSHDALIAQEQDPASIVLVDWLMPNMNGLELTKKIRQLDEAANRYTYVMMLTAKDGADALRHAFEEGVDDFLNKSNMQDQLLPRVYAAERLVDNQNRLLTHSQALIDANRDLQRLCNIDPLTGLGNQRYARDKLIHMLKHTESRGGATCILLVEVQKTELLKRDVSPKVYDEIMLGVSRRLHTLMRPMDIVCRYNHKQFIVITHQPDITQATQNSFKRIFDGINLRAFKTSEGFHNVQVAISVVSSSFEFGIPTADALMNVAMQGLEESKVTERIALNYFRDI